MNKFMLCEIERILQNYSVKGYCLMSNENVLTLQIDFEIDKSKGGNNQ